MASRKRRDGHYKHMKNWRLQIFILILLTSCTSSPRKSRRERSGRIYFAAFDLLLFKNTNLRGTSGRSYSTAWSKVLKSSLKLLPGSRWDTRKRHWVGSNRKTHSVPGQHSSKWGLAVPQAWCGSLTASSAARKSGKGGLTRKHY